MDTSIEYWCLLIDDEGKPKGEQFRVPVFPRDITIDHFKVNVKGEKPNGLKDVDHNDLEIWRPKEPTRFDESDPEVEDVIRQLFANKKVEKLTARKTLALLNLTSVQTLLVHVPDGPRNERERVSPGVGPPSPIHLARYIPRTDTVSGLYKKLKRYKYIQVRGTPASGKTTLAEILHGYIMEVEPFPKPLVVYLRAWPPNDQVAYGNWEPWLFATHSYAFQPGSVLIVDEAQTSYHERSFWMKLKTIDESSPCSVITFAGYGSAGQDLDHDTTPLRIRPLQHISLFATDNGDGLSVGLLLSRPDFDAFVNKFYRDHPFDSSFLDAVYGMTNGHVGACHDVLALVETHNSYRSMRNSGQLYRYESFVAGMDPFEFLTTLKSGSKFARGLPTPPDVQNTACGEVFQIVLRDGCIIAGKLYDLDQENPLYKCVKKGWLFNEPISGHEGMFIYTFTTPLHRRYIQEKLLGSETPVTIQEANIHDFVIAILRKYSPINLQPRKANPISQSIPEAQFQDEFYRASYAHTSGAVLSFPEFGNDRGRIDFFIPSKKWGIELLRDGNRLAAHAKRFTAGEYASWIAQGVIDDYAIIDFRTEMTMHKRPGYGKLYFAVSENQWNKMVILNNMKEPIVEEFNLLHGEYA
ncbi:hypothetical protein BD410DRAFT_797614 [Rickenella mellea]|uniref:Uncharacterized protein n=1 Tax=Rickenella mellea TaxID=50990 RepID=A0A4Y7PDU3_9AGAM|nr:hypothetical protein BD410DRAFT_797614 [Rickenella mellea]